MFWGFGLDFFFFFPAKETLSTCVTVQGANLWVLVVCQKSVRSTAGAPVCGGPSSTTAIMADPVPWHGGCSAVVVTPCRGDILAGTRTGLRAAPACAVEELGRGGYTQGEEATHRHPFHGCSAGKAGPRERI